MFQKEIYGKYLFKIPLKSGIIILSLGGFTPMSGDEMKKLYIKNGWVELRQKGSHVQMGKGPLRETIPMHKELGKGLEHKLLKKLRGEK